jgi:hypothetical protein
MEDQNLETRMSTPFSLVCTLANCFWTGVVWNADHPCWNDLCIQNLKPMVRT